MMIKWLDKMKNSKKMKNYKPPIDPVDINTFDSKQ